MVVSWLINSMHNGIGRKFLLYTTTKVERETYLNNENTTNLFKVKSVLQGLWQGDMKITQYFNSLTRHS